jgi:hypothetical protein
MKFTFHGRIFYGLRFSPLGCVFVKQGERPVMRRTKYLASHHIFNGERYAKCGAILIFARSEFTNYIFVQVSNVIKYGIIFQKPL